MHLVETILPIFLIILLGYLVRTTRFVGHEFFVGANRFIYFFSLPVLIFTGIVTSGLRAFSVMLILSVVVPTVVVCLLGYALGRSIGLQKGRLGTFVQSSYHGNVSYIGLAVVLYMLGEEAFRQGSIMVGFLVLTTNVLSSIVLSVANSKSSQEHGPTMFEAIAKNPVIIASLAGMCSVYLSLPIPAVLLKSMGILAHIALPLALVTIGASLTPGSARKSLRLGLLVSGVKLLLLPSLGLVFLHVFRVPLRSGSAGILLLATPVATLAYIMAEEMGGDGELASNSVTLSTILALFTYMGWAIILQIV